MLTFTARHLWRHWRMNLVVLAGMLLGSALLSGLSTYAQVIAGQSLRQSLIDAHPSARNLRVSGQRLTDASEQDIRAALRDLVRQRVEIRDVTVDAQRTILRACFKSLGSCGTLRGWTGKHTRVI